MARKTTARNLVAKYSRRINRPAVHRDRRAALRRGEKPKHRHEEMRA